VWRLTPGAQGDILELYAESENARDMEAPDNIVQSASGDIYIAEDGGGSDRLVGITPAGKYFELAHVRVSDSETAGATFSPDGKSLYFNIQGEGLTLAITGPFRTAPASTDPPMARALPSRNLEPKVPTDYLMTAMDRGYRKLEAAALHRLELPLS
jgi:secreted PhoX family phosphatase